MPSPSPAPTPPTPRPLSAAPGPALAALRYVLTDIDDTLTEAGRLPALALEAMEALAAAGLSVIPVTGRPAGWCDAIARQWPVAAVVGENGALWYAEDRVARRMIRWQAQDEAASARARCCCGRISRNQPAAKSMSSGANWKRIASAPPSAGAPPATWA